MPFMDDLLDLADSLDGDDDGRCFDVTVHRHGTVAAVLHQGHGPPHVDPLVLEPGEPHSIVLCMAQPDPLLVAQGYRFEPFLLPGGDPLLVDIDGDGVPDHTRWGTPVERVDGYVRADGTEITGHYRTAADGARWNNLERWR